MRPVAGLLNGKHVDAKGMRSQTWPAAALLNDMFAGCSSLVTPDFSDCGGLPSSTM